MVEELLATLKVEKRNGKKVDFDGSKIAIAIKKGFDSVEINSDEEEGQVKLYNEKDIQKIYQSVMNRIEKDYKESTKIKIEDIQDLIEEELEKKGYNDVYKSFSEYRERRNASRELFFGEKKTHKFLKSIVKSLDFKRKKLYY